VVKLDNGAVKAVDYLIWCMIFCTLCPAFAA